MNKKTNFKKFAAACMLAASVVGIPTASGDEVVKVIGDGNLVLGFHPATSVDHIEFGESTSIVIPLSETISFKMIKVEGGVPYTLTNSNGEQLTAGAWGEDGATKMMEDFWIGEFEVTQGVWKEVMGVTDEELPVSNKDYTFGGILYPKGSKQSAIGNNYPIANVSWEDICMGDESFIAKLNERLKELKASDPELAAVLGDREFRLPNEWEWTYAAAGGKDYETMNYFYPGTSYNTIEALDRVAVNGTSGNLASVAEIGSKLPNALGLYDMAGNTYELCSSLGYPGHEDTPGQLNNNGSFIDDIRSAFGGSFVKEGDNNSGYRIKSKRGYNNYQSRVNTTGFRLAL